jgi:hypothetical protein
MPCEPGDGDPNGIWQVTFCDGTLAAKYLGEDGLLDFEKPFLYC